VICSGCGTGSRMPTSSLRAACARAASIGGMGAVMDRRVAAGEDGVYATAVSPISKTQEARFWRRRSVGGLADKLWRSRYSKAAGTAPGGPASILSILFAHAKGHTDALA
jgi:hypothetical protein